MAESSESFYTPAWPSEVSVPDNGALEPLTEFLNQMVLPNASAINRPAKVMERSGLVWTAAKRRQISSVAVVEGVRLYRRNGRNGRVVGGSDDNSLSLVSDMAEEIEQSKTTVKSFLSSAGLPTPEGRLFQTEEESAAQKYAGDFDSVTIKPNGRTAGRGVSSWIARSESFQGAWRVAVGSLSTRETRPQEKGPLSEEACRVLVEPQIVGLPLRVYVVGERVVGALVRLPMFAIGDGVRSVQDLAQAFLTWRNQNKFLRQTAPTWPVLNQRWGRMGVDLQRVPQRGEFILLQDSPSIHGGGFSVDVTDQVSDELADMAVSALWSIPGMTIGGIEILTPGLRSAVGAAVVGVNSRASFQIHEYPGLGSGRQPAEWVFTQLVRASLR